MIKLNNVRLTYPSLWKTEIYGEEDTKKYAATFVLDKIKHASEITHIKNTINAGIRKNLKEQSLPDNTICLKDGDETGRLEFSGSYIIKATNRLRPSIVDRNKRFLNESDNKPYSGCYVNAIIDIWYQNNIYGKRVNSNLLGIQFYKDGEPFGMSQIDVTSEFDEYNDELPF